MSDNDSNTTEAPTRREYVKYGGAVITGGVLAGCAGQGDSGSTPTGTPTETSARDDATATETETPTETSGGDGATETETQTPEDESYEVCMEPVGCHTFEEVPERWIGGFGFLGDVALSLGVEDGIVGMIAPETWYTGWYDELPGVSVDTDEFENIRGEDGNVDKEILYEINPDLIAVDPNMFTVGYGLDQGDYEEIKENIAPFFGNRSRRKRPDWLISEEYAVEPGEYAYYSIEEYVDIYGRVFDRSKRATTVSDFFTRTIEGIRADIPPVEERPSIGLIHPTWPDPQNGEFSVYRPTPKVEKTYGKKPYNDLGVVDAFEGRYEGGSPIKVDYELLLEVDPDAFVFHFGVLNTEDGQVEATREAMRESPLGSELTAVQEDRLYLGGTAYQGPIINLFQTEMLAKQLYPEQFGEWHGPGETPEDEQLFDRQKLADIINGNT